MDDQPEAQAQEQEHDVTIAGTPCCVLEMASATAEEVKEFCGSYLHYVRRDGVAAIGEPMDVLAEVLADPAEGDLLVKPSGQPKVKPLVISGKVQWAKELIGE